MSLFDRIQQKADLWMEDLMNELGWGNREMAYHALRAALHALRDRLSVEEAVQMGAQLPTLIRGMYYEGWTPRGKPLRVRSKGEFLELVSEPFNALDPRIDPEEITRAVFRVLARRIAEGEVSDVRAILPKPIEELWPKPIEDHRHAEP